MSAGVTLLQGSLFTATGLAIVQTSRVAVTLVWTTTVLAGFGVIARGATPLDLLLWLVGIGLALWYTKKQRVTPVKEGPPRTGAAEHLQVGTQHPISVPGHSDKKSLEAPGIAAAANGDSTAKRIAIVIGSVVVLLFGWLVWPTPYRYDTTGSARIPVRTNRFTGDVERLDLSQGWKKVVPLPTCASLAGTLIEQIGKRNRGECR